MVNNFYQTLRVQRTASVEEITDAYKQLALQYYPLKNRSIGGSVSFRKVAEAYEVLSDPQKRELFDKLLKAEGGMVRRRDFPYTLEDDGMATYERVFGPRNQFMAQQQSQATFPPPFLSQNHSFLQNPINQNQFHWNQPLFQNNVQNGWNQIPLQNQNQNLMLNNPFLGNVPFQYQAAQNGGNQIFLQNAQNAGNNNNQNQYQAAGNGNAQNYFDFDIDWNAVYILAILLVVVCVFGFLMQIFGFFKSLLAYAVFAAIMYYFLADDD